MFLPLNSFLLIPFALSLGLLLCKFPQRIYLWFGAGRHCNRLLNCLSLQDVWVIQSQYRLILCLIGLFQSYCILPDVNKGLLAECVFPVLHRCSVRCGSICYHSWAHYPEFGKWRVCRSINVCIWTEFWTMWHRARLWSIFPVASLFSRSVRHYKWISPPLQRFNWQKF